MPEFKRRGRNEELEDTLRARGDVEHVVARSGRPVYEPPCSCLECETHFYLKEEQAQYHWFCYTRRIDDLEATSFLRGDVEEIKTSHAYIKRAVDMHGDAILNAWRKRSTGKRAMILREVEHSKAERKGLYIDLSIAGLNSGSD